MKRFSTACAAGAFSFTLLFNINTLIPSIKASAADVTLTPAQTRALFSDRLSCQYYDGTDYQECYFDYFSTAVVNREATAYSGSWQNNGFSILNQTVLIYRCSANDFGVISSNPSNQLTAILSPIFDISNINTFKLTCGFSTGRSTASDPYGWWEPNSYRLNQWNIYSDYRNYNDSTLSRQSFTIQNNTDNVKWTELKIYDPDNDGTFLYGAFNTFQLNLVDSYKAFTVKSTLDKASTGLYLSSIQTTMVGKLTTSGSGRYDDYYFFISCPYLSDTYIADDPPSWDSGGDESSSGDYDGPDYSGDLQDIIDRLDAIILENQVLIDQNSGIENELALGNDKLNQTNSKLDQVNSNLNKIDSHLQAMQIPDLVSQSGRDSSHIADNTSRMANEISEAMRDHQYIDSLARSAEMSLPNLDNKHALDSSFNDLWYYTDDSGLKWSNPLLFAMPIVTLTIGVLSYIIFGKKG